MKDLAVIGDTCTIACDKDGVNFSVSGDLGKGNIMVRNNTSVDKEEVSKNKSNRNRMQFPKQNEHKKRRAAVVCLECF